MSPQYVDLNNDGNKDLITGCFEGGLYWMAGTGDGEFAAPASVLDCDGEVLRVGQFWCDEDNEWKLSEADLGISGHAVDYDEDGDMDLLLGSNDGHIFVRINEGSADQPSYSSENIQLKSGTGEDSQVLYTGDGHALPIVFDWDNDGLFDIISGSNRSGVVWARNVGKKGHPRFAEMKVLVEAGRQDPEGVKVGDRLQVAAGDFDNDGINDLVVGDFNSSYNDNRSEEDKKRYKDLSKLISSNSNDHSTLTSRLESAKETEDSDLVEDLEGQLKQIVADRRELLKEYSTLVPKRETHGYVWLFRGK